jgi:hypothetical protein
MYAQIKDGLVVAYPLNEYAIRSQFPNSSLPKDLANNLPSGYVRVLPGVKPAQTEYTIVTEGTPELVDGEWIQVFVVSQKYSEQELEVLEAKKQESKWDKLRGERDGLLVQSDHVVSRHKEQKELGLQTSITEVEYVAWLEYRQQLRDFPASYSGDIR